MLPATFELGVEDATLVGTTPTLTLTILQFRPGRQVEMHSPASELIVEARPHTQNIPCWTFCNRVWQIRSVQTFGFWKPHPLTTSSVQSHRMLPITSISKHARQLLQLRPILLIETAFYRTIDVDDGHDLSKWHESQHFLHVVVIKLTFPSRTIGTTISLLEAPSQAMCPGNFSTSSTRTVLLLSAAAPQTPFPNLIV